MNPTTTPAQPSALAAAQAGDSDAIEELIRGIERPVYAALGRLLTSLPRASVDDVAQDAFMRIIDHLGRYRADRGAKFSTWAVTVAVRVGLDALRKSRRRLRRVVPGGSDGLLDRIAGSQDGPEAQAVGRQLGRRVEEAMAALTPEQRGVLILRAFHELTYEEIGAALGLKIPAVKSRLHRARQALHGAMNEGRGAV